MRERTLISGDGGGDRRWFLGSSVAAAALLILSRADGSAAEAGRLRVVATTTLVMDLVKEIGADRVEAEALMGPGVDPHLYKASAGDVARLGRAQVIFYSGLFLEGRMDEVFRGLRSRGRPVVGVAEKVPREALIQPAGQEAHPDPHVWGDPVLWSHAVGVVAETLATEDPGGAAGYRERARAYQERLKALVDWGKKRVQEIPVGQRVLVTSHDAFNYFGRVLGLEVLGVQGISTAAAAGLADVTRVVDRVRERKLKAIFVESSVSPTTIQRISRDAGAKIGGELFSDALGTPGDMHTAGGESYDVGTYIGMWKHNVNTVVDGLK